MLQFTVPRIAIVIFVRDRSVGHVVTRIQRVQNIVRISRSLSIFNDPLMFAIIQPITHVVYLFVYMWVRVITVTYSTLDKGYSFPDEGNKWINVLHGNALPLYTV